MAPIQVSIESNENEINKLIRDKFKKGQNSKLEIQLEHLFYMKLLTKEILLIEVMTFIQYEKKIDDALPSYCLESFPRRYNEALWKNSSFTKTQNDNIIN